jgi:NADPH-dependent 2,4-dienoyl-CoA reductase/sulfur reductase-like enzyme
MKKIVVVGGGAAGASAASRAKRLDPSSEVILVEKSDMITHAPCGIPYYIENLVKERNDLITYTAEQFEKERGIKVYLNSEVIDIDVDKRSIEILKNGSREKITWDRLILATGAEPSKPPVPGTDLEGVLTIHHPAEADYLRKKIEDMRVVAVVGGGYIGIELAEALHQIGKKVLLFELTDQLLPTSLDKDMASIVAEYMRSKGIELHLSEGLKEIIGKERVEKLITEKSEYAVDGVILATGVKPNNLLAKKIGLKLGVAGAVEVNEYMETNIPDIYAAGDLVEKYHKILKKKVWIPLAPTANKEGLVAGANAVKGRFLRFPGVVGTAVTKFFDLYIARTGISEREASENNIKVESRVIKVRTKAHYYPGGAEANIKILVESGSGRILGAQAIGRDPVVASYIDIMAIVIERGMSIEELFFSDLGYMPATAPVWHPLVVAARVMSKGVL